MKWCNKENEYDEIADNVLKSAKNKNFYIGGSRFLWR